MADLGVATHILQKLCKDKHRYQTSSFPRWCNIPSIKRIRHHIRCNAELHYCQNYSFLIPIDINQKCSVLNNTTLTVTIDIKSIFFDQTRCKRIRILIYWTVNNIRVFQYNHIWRFKWNENKWLIIYDKYHSSLYIPITKMN